MQMSRCAVRTHARRSSNQSINRSATCRFFSVGWQIQINSLDFSLLQKNIRKLNEKLNVIFLENQKLNVTK